MSAQIHPAPSVQNTASNGGDAANQQQHLQGSSAGADKPIIYVNGKYVPKSQAMVSVYDHGLLYGDGVFEGIRVYKKIFGVQTGPPPWGQCRGDPALRLTSPARRWSMSSASASV